MNKPLLAIETSGNSLGVALRGAEGLLFEANVIAGAMHGKALAPLIQDALRRQKLQPGDLAGVAVSSGPGSWTGLRIGLTAAKAFAWGAGLRLVPVPSFEALALEAGRLAPGHARLTLRNARSEGFFAALFDETLHWPERWIADSVLTLDDLRAAVARSLVEHPGVRLSICGDEACLVALAPAAGAEGWKLLRDCVHIPARAVAELGAYALRQGRFLHTPAEIHRLAPLYLRASDPELKLKKRSGQ